VELWGVFIFKNGGVRLVSAELNLSFIATLYSPINIALYLINKDIFYSFIIEL